MGMKYSFAELGSNILTRKFGGTTVGVADPYVSGYHFVWFDKIPPGLAGYIASNGISGISSTGEVQNILAASCLSVLEFNKTPLLDIMHNWVKLIRDYRTGATDLEDGDQGEGYTKKTYAGLMYYWTTAPDAKTVEFYAAYDGVFPAKDPQDLFTSDVETVGRLDLEIEFNVDYTWHEPWVLDKCQKFANTFAQVKDTVKNYGPKQSSGT